MYRQGDGRPGSDAYVLPAIHQTSSHPLWLIYTALADTGELDGPRNPDRSQYELFQKGFDAYFAQHDLSDGWAIMAHDATLTAAKAIRLADDGPAQPLPSAGTVRDLIYDLNKITSAPGATGDIAVNQSGDPVHPNVPVLETDPTGRQTLLDIYSP